MVKRHFWLFVEPEGIMTPRQSYTVKEKLVKNYQENTILLLNRDIGQQRNIDFQLGYFM